MANHTDDSPMSGVLNPMDCLEVVEAIDAVKEKRAKRRADEISAEEVERLLSVPRQKIGLYPGTEIALPSIFALSAHVRPASRTCGNRVKFSALK